MRTHIAADLCACLSVCVMTTIGGPAQRRESGRVCGALSPLRLPAAVSCFRKSYISTQCLYEVQLNFINMYIRALYAQVKPLPLLVAVPATRRLTMAVAYNRLVYNKQSRYRYLNTTHARMHTESLVLAFPMENSIT